MILDSGSTELHEGKFPDVLLAWRIKEEHVQFLHGIQNMEFNNKCVTLMRYWEAASGKCSEKYSETHIPSGCSINYKNKPNYIHTWLSIFCFPQPVPIFHFLRNLAALLWSSIISKALVCLVALSNFQFSRNPWNGLGDMITKRLRNLCVFLSRCTPHALPIL